MNTKIRILFLAIGVGLATISFAQSGTDYGCYDGANTYTYTCSTVNPPCSTKITVTEPGAPVDSGEDGDFYVETSQPLCCVVHLQNWTYGGGCQGPEVRTPEAQERLAEVSATTDILVANCKHHYVAIERQLQAVVGTSISLDAEDRTLR